MSNQDDKKDIEELREFNAELTGSLARCRKLLNECRSKLAANANEPLFFPEIEDTRLG